MIKQIIYRRSIWRISHLMCNAQKINPSQTASPLLMISTGPVCPIGSQKATLILYGPLQQLYLKVSQTALCLDETGRQLLTIIFNVSGLIFYPFAKNPQMALLLIGFESIASRCFVRFFILILINTKLSKIL